MKFGNSDWQGVTWNGQVIGGPPGAPRPPQAPTTGGMAVHRASPQGPLVVSTNPQQFHPQPGMPPPQMMPPPMPPQVAAGWPQAPMPQPQPQAWAPPPQPAMPAPVPPRTAGSPGAFRLGAGAPVVQPTVNSQPLPPMQVPPQQLMAPPSMPVPPPQPAGWGSSSPLPGAPTPVPVPAPGPSPVPVPASYDPVPYHAAPASPVPAPAMASPPPPPPPVPEHSMPTTGGAPPPPMEGAPPVHSAPGAGHDGAPDLSQYRPGPISTTPLHVPGLNLQSDQIVTSRISREQMLVANATQNPPMGAREITDHARPVMRTVMGAVDPNSLQRGHVQPRFGQFVKEAPNANAHVPAAQNVRVPFGHSQVLAPPPPDPTKIRR